MQMDDTETGSGLSMEELLGNVNISDDYVDPFASCEWPSEEQGKLLALITELVTGYGSIIIAIIGVIANSLAICVFARRSFRSNFNDLLIALALFDLIFLVIMITESVRNNFEPRFGDSSSISGLLTQLHHHLFPYLLFPLMNILLTCSVYMTVSISVERYLAIFYPLVYKARQGSAARSQSWHILPVIILAIIINIPTFLCSKVEVVTQDLLEERFDPSTPSHSLPALESTLIGVTDIRKHQYYVFYYHALTRFLLLGFIPMVLLIVLNLRVFSAIQARKSTCRDASYSNILLLIVLVFILCHSPRLFLNFYELVLDHCGPPIWFEVLSVMSNCLVTLNSALNFFIYCLAGAKFRQGLRSLVCCSAGNPPGPPSTSHTGLDLKTYSTKL